MRRWCGPLGWLLWLAGTGIAAVAACGGVVATPVTLRLADGTTIHGAVYRARGATGPAPAAVVLHGTAVSHSSCAPGLAVPLARAGFVVLAVDLRGHGRSGGALRKDEYGDLPALLNAPADHAELDAAVAYLKSQPDVDATRLALVGHSRGGWVAATAGCRRQDVACVVSVSSAPTVCDALRPRNLLLLAGGFDEVIPPRQYAAALARATDGAAAPGQWLGDTDAGTARQLVVSPWSLHLSTLADPTATRRMVQWASWCFRRDPGTVPGERLQIAAAAALVASLGALLAAAVTLSALAESLLPAPTPTAPCRPFRTAFLVLAALVVAPVAVLLSDRLPDGGLLFWSHAFALLLVAGAFAALIGQVVVAPRPPVTDRRSLTRGALLGLAGGGLVLILLGVTWGSTWLDLIPTPRRVLAGVVLFALFLPCCLALAAGAGSALRNAAWPALWLAVWLGHAWLLREGRPFLGIPTLFVALSAAVPLPLWLLRDRPGLGAARAVSHALGAACFLAWHLPFVG